MSSSSQGQASLLRVLQSKNETRAFYDKISDFYDLLAEHSEAPVREAGLEILKASGNEIVLEIGCATGHSLVQLAKAVPPGGAVFGLDLSERMLRLSAGLLRSEKLTDTVSLVCGDAVRLPFAAGTLDAIFMSFTLELFDTPEIPAVLRECRRALKVNGRIVVVAISKEGPAGAVLEAFEWTHRHFPNLLDCRPIFVRRALEEAGFKVGTAASMNMWVPVELVQGTKTCKP